VDADLSSIRDEPRFKKLLEWIAERERERERQRKK
jgi:hypothetical protein